MKKSNSEELNSEEGKKKAESLFSKKFMDYLTNKTLSAANKADKSLLLSGAFSTSSDDTSLSGSSGKSTKRGRKKAKEERSHWDFHHSFRNRLAQCSLLKVEEEVAPPDELKPLLMNVTVLLQDLRQSSPDLEPLCSLISKITILVTEFLRRPLKKVQEDKKSEHSKSLEKAIDTMIGLLEEYKNGPNLDPDNSIREYKRIEKEIANKDQQITEKNQKLSFDNHKTDSKTKDLIVRLKKSISINEKLKSEIKFNHAHIKKYKKILLEKEWTKHKLDTELAHFKKKLSKADLSESDSFDRKANSAEAKCDSLRATANHHKTKPFPSRGKAKHP